MTRTLRIATCVIVLCFAIGRPATLPAAPVDPITEWSVAASKAAAASGMAPLRTPISLALLHVAMFDAVTAITGNGRPRAAVPAATGPASAYAAAVEAGYSVAMAEFPSQADALRATYERLLMAEPDSAKKQNGLAVGGAIARDLLESRANDGRNATVVYTPGSGAGVWVPTPPGFLAATSAFLARVTPFTMDTASQFRPSGPPSLGSRQWRAEYDEVKALGARFSSHRTPEQTATALFWEPLAGTVWVPTIRRIAAEQALDLPSSARFQAAAFAAFADGLIACWEAKFHFNFWRPITAIQQGDADGNPQNDTDGSWEPLAITPNFPEYPSGHTCVSAAVAHTIESFFHHDVLIPARNIASGEERLFRRATDLVDEVVEARMLLGVHFRAGDEDGAEMGHKIARQIRRTWLSGRR